MILNETEIFTILSVDNNVSIPIYDSDVRGRTLISDTAITSDMTVVEISENSFPLVKVEYELNGEKCSGWTIFDFTSPLNTSENKSKICNLSLKNILDLPKLNKTYNKVLQMVANKEANQASRMEQNNPSNTSQNGTQYVAYSTTSGSGGYNVRDIDGDIIVSPNVVGNGSFGSTVNLELESIVRSYGVPPQWTKHVDPRIVSCKFTGGKMNVEARLGRRFIEVTLSNPTVVDIAPGYVYFNSATLSDNSAVFDSDGDGLWEAIKQNHGSLFTIKPCFGSFEYTGGSGTQKVRGYMSYVNVLARIVAVYMSRRALNTSSGRHRYYYRDSDQYVDLEELKDRPVPGFGKIYREFLWEDYDSQDWITVGGFSVGYKSNSEDNFIYVRFFTIEGTSSQDTFSTDVGETTIESSINGLLSGAMKDVAFLMGGVVGGALGNTMQEVESSIYQAINGGVGGIPGAGTISSLLHSVTSFATGGKLVFPKVITDCSYGKSMTVKCTFPAIYGDSEANFLNSMLPYIHVLAFCLPHQLKTTMDMYTYPFLVKAFSKGIFSCDMGVLTNLQVNRGGEDGELWSYDSNSTEISVSFEITPLISKLMMSSLNDGAGWILKNHGLQEYLGGLCGVDLRNNRIAMAKELFFTMIQGQASSWFNNIVNSWIANTGIGNLINLGTMFNNYINPNGNGTTDTSTYADNGETYTEIPSDTVFPTDTPDTPESIPQENTL